MKATLPIATQVRLAAVLASALLLHSIGGCASIPDPTPLTEEETSPRLTMMLLPGDRLNIDFVGAPELNSEQTIRRDGKISVKLAGEIQAAGRTPEELQKVLLSLYGARLQVKAVNVLVMSPMPIFVTGSVLKPGRYEINRDITALEAVMEAGGFEARSAEVRSVVVMRHQHGERKGYILDYKGALSGEKGEPFFLRPFDIVYVPRTRIVKIDQWVEQHINALLPRLGVGYDSEGDYQISR